MPTYSVHARQQMSRRGYTEADVEAVLAHEVQTPRLGSRLDTLCRVGLDARGELLEIVVDIADTNHVVSVLGRPNRRRVRR